MTKRAKVVKVEPFMQREWPQQPLVQRLNDCKFMLLLHECLSDAESERVFRRIKKLAARLAKTTIPARNP